MRNEFSTITGSSSYGAYRKSKMVIDVLNIILAVVIVVLFVALIFLNNHRSMLFPVIFLAGGIDNGIASAKCFMNYNRTGGIALVFAALALFVLSVFSFQVR